MNKKDNNSSLLKYLVVGMLGLVIGLGCAVVVWFITRDLKDKGMDKNENVSTETMDSSDDQHENESEDDKEEMTVEEEQADDERIPLSNVGYTYSDFDSVTREDFVEVTSPDGVYSFMYPDKIFYTGYYDPEEKSYYLESYDGITTLSIVENEAVIQNDPVKCSQTLYRYFLKDYVLAEDSPYSRYSDSVGESGFSRCIFEGEDKESGKFVATYAASNKSKTYVLKFTCQSQGYAAKELMYTMRAYVVDCIYRGWSISGSTYKLRTVSQYMTDDWGEKEDE